jgi:nitrogen regulatory protein PII
VKAALYGKGVFSGMTSTEVHGYTDGLSRRLIYRGLVQRVDLFPRIKLEVVTHDDLVERVLQAIAGSAPTERGRDGEFLVSEVSESVCIRTGEIDEAAIA